MGRPALIDAPADGPARIELDPEGFVARRPDTATLARDLAIVALPPLLFLAILAAVVAVQGGSFPCWVFVVVVPGPISVFASGALWRLVHALRGVHVLRCTPSELVIERGGGVDRIALADIRRVRTAGAGEILLDLGRGAEEMLEIAADAGQSRWLAEAVAAAAERARRIPEPPERPPALDALRARTSER